MIKAAIIGATGYTGITLMEILLKHKDVHIKYITSKSYVGKKFSEIYPKFEGLTDLVCIEEDINTISKDVDVIFIALPHGIASGKINNDILKNSKVIDLGADFRLKDKNIYEAWYQVEHKTPQLLDEAVYGLCELNREKIKKAKLIANPGCYTTASILALSPLVKHKLIDTKSIIIDAKSGVSGAGRSLNIPNLYCEANENIKAYKVGSHRHTVEIEQELSILNDNNEINLIFTPHLTPMNRGILATCYVKSKNDVNIDELLAFHRAHGKIGTMSMYNFGQTKGIVDVGNNGIINAFREKSDFDGDLINIGYMVFEPALFDYIEGDNTIFEKEPLTKLVEDGQLAGYVHKGFWQCMDTLREKQKLEKLWEDGNAPWKIWKD